MKKNTKIILGSVIGIAVLGAATLALVLTQPESDNADSGTSSSETVSVTDYTTDFDYSFMQDVSAVQYFQYTEEPYGAYELVTVYLNQR